MKAEPPRWEETPEGNVSDTASSSLDNGKTPQNDNGDVPALNADVRTLRKVQESMLQRFENKEKRDTLQHEEDFRVLKQILEDWIKEIRDLFTDGSRKTSRREKEKVMVYNSSSSDTSTPRSNHRSPKEPRGSRRQAKSASAQKRERLSRT